MSGSVFYQLHITLHLLPIRTGSAPERSPATAVMRRVITRLSAPELLWSAIHVTVKDIEHSFALGEEDMHLLCPTPHEYCL